LSALNTWKDITVDSYGWTAMLTVQQDGIPEPMQSYAAQFVFTPPKGVEKVRAASFATNGADGVFSYTIASGDIDKTGTWWVVATVTASGLSITTVPIQFKVGKKR
jgi:hypothetical protein